MNYLRAVGKKNPNQEKIWQFDWGVIRSSYLYRHCVACLISLIWHHGALIIIFH